MKITFEATIEEFEKLEKLFGEDKPKEERKSGRYKWESTEFTAWFNEDCYAWSMDSNYNKMHLQYQQSYFNDLLKMRGHLYLNEVYDSLGIPRIKAGQMVGWIFEDESSFVDFGLKDPRNQDFINGETTDCLLIFNVNGVIIDRI